MAPDPRRQLIVMGGSLIMMEKPSRDTVTCSPYEGTGYGLNPSGMWGLLTFGRCPLIRHIPAHWQVLLWQSLCDCPYMKNVRATRKAHALKLNSSYKRTKRNRLPIPWSEPIPSSVVVRVTVASHRMFKNGTTREVLYISGMFYLIMKYKLSNIYLLDK